MKRLSDINRCSLTGFPPNTKKEYSGLIGRWLYKKEIYPVKKKSIYIIEEWEFGWKQMLLKSSYNEYSNKLNNRNYRIWDYNSCFIVFKIIVVTKDSVVTDCKLVLDSTDDGEFIIDFEYSVLNICKIKRFFENNYKYITLDDIREFMKLCQ